jgi:hypothetical protein
VDICGAVGFLRTEMLRPMMGTFTPPLLLCAGSLADKPKRKKRRFRSSLGTAVDDDG